MILSRITRRTKNAITFQYTVSSRRSHSTITVPPEIQRAAADILISVPPTAAFTHLEDIQSDKYLGVVLDNRLSFNKHTDGIAKKEASLCTIDFIYFLKKTYKFYNATLIVNIFQFIDASILHYCSLHRNAQYGPVPFRVLKLKIED